MRGLKQLTTLDLSGNRLIALSETTLEEIDILGLESHFNLTLNLSGNPFQCTCDTLYFLKWIESKKDSVKNVILKGLKNDSCSFANLKERSLSEISTIILELEKVCFSKSVVIVLSVILIIVFFFIIIIGVFHRYRWKLRYIYYLTRRSLRGYFNRQNGTGNRRKYFEFDAFISFAEEDRTFAFECLTSEILDRQPSLKLCYHHIHFLPGSGIAENIVNAVHNSRKTICVLSKHFLVSEWCLYEFNMANFEKIYNRGDENSLIILILGHVSYDRIPVTMMSYLQSTSYIEVPEENDDRRVLWNNICDAIHDD
ncbi:hypothetical protein FSP39_005396 [Pinctada imbricata]|uniref:TIR domain-containing protein n=1 Tax=Pinctada imbricata TaxID=66713 RepID=A0AA88XHS1_PINIB|nr:hypothetical protein FSP39_005396 [Pinctada imbricata]